jgi:hypothetical protein
MLCLHSGIASSSPGILLLLIAIGGGTSVRRVSDDSLFWTLYFGSVSKFATGK